MYHSVVLFKKGIIMDYIFILQWGWPFIVLIFWGFVGHLIIQSALTRDYHGFLDNFPAFRFLFVFLFGWLYLMIGNVEESKKEKDEETDS